MSNKTTSLFPRELVREAFTQSFVKLAPRTMVRNPVMFTVEIGTLIMLLVTLYTAFSGDGSQGSFGYNLAVFLVLFVTLLFANFAEAIAEARGKAQAASLRKLRADTPARLKLADGSIKTLRSSELRKGDLFFCEVGDTIPMDGEIIQGLASIDESAITGESAPVIREAGGDRSGVTGGTRVLSDRITVKVTGEPGTSFLDRMIALVEGASRQKTPNEIALTILLAGFTLVFLIVCVTLKPFADYANTAITIASFISLFVCLIPTTIGGLLSAIGIAGMDRALQANVITKSGRAVETAGDIDVLLLDKTGTITIGNRKATAFHPAPGIEKSAFIKACVLSSLADETPEGKSIVELAGAEVTKGLSLEGAQLIKFTAETRTSGLDMGTGLRIRKGAQDAIRKIVERAGSRFPQEVDAEVKRIAANGGTPLVVSENDKVIGSIELQDIIKPGIQERFGRLRKMGVKTVMVTGDNPLTAKFIAEKAGVDDFIAEATPEDKMAYIKKEQQAGRLVAMMGDGTNDAPALAQADVGVAMNSGTQAAKEAGNMVDLDNDPTKLIEVVEIGKQLLMTRGTLTTFSIANDVAKYFAIVPALFMVSIPALSALNIMNLYSAESAILSAVIFNAIIIPLLIPLALRGVAYRPIGASAILRRNLLIYGLGGVIVPFIGIKLIDLLITPFFGAMKTYLTPALRMTAVMLVLCCGIYTLIVWGFAGIAAPQGGEAELIERDGKPVGAALVGQLFTSDGYFQGRPSAIDYNAQGSSGSNKGPSNPDYLATVQARIDSFLVHNPGVQRADIPSELVTASGSGLDPHLSVQAASVQVKRIAQARGLDEGALQKLIGDHTDGPLLGLFGTSTINILELNMALDALK